MAKSVTLSQGHLNILRGIAYTPPTSLKVGLFTTVPTRALAGDEPTDPAYTRQTITLAAPGEEGGKSACKNSNLIDFGTVTQPVTIVAFGLYDNAGTYLYGNTLTSAKSLESGDRLEFGINEISVTES